jgi:exonuclease VII large subunit
VVQDERGTVVRRAADVAPGDTLRVRVADGELTAEVRTTG